jgi:serine/threonine protein kinase/tetratricopeptide (TPR) repeat protein
MDKSSKKTSAFGLSGEKIAHLLSIGREDDFSDVEHKDKNVVDFHIEGYEIIEKIAEAGQGQVWRAIQLSTGRHVAIKAPKVRSVNSEGIMLRFEREIELVARLKHPNIARIYDSGVDQGHYYYVMDFVSGLNLDEYVRQNKLTHRQILELVRIICQAVQHAHQNRVIHRDLKPSNIIISDEGHPYIVDFGLAKVILEDEQGPTISMDGETVGTPAYMSPEQAAGRVDEVDTRTDIYSLGVILFNLLTGESPYDLSGSRQQVLRRIADGKIKRPRTVCRSIDRELETLLMKTLDRDPDRRYSTASSLAGDIENYLNGAPLMAGPPSTLYRLKKFIRRNAALSSAILAAILILIVGLITTMVMYVRADQARTEAQAVSDFLRNSVLASLDLFKVGGREITIRSVLDTASKSLEGDLEGMPLAEAEIQDALGNAYWSLGLSKKAEQHLKRALDIQQSKQGPEHPATLATAHQLGWVYYAQSRYPEAEQLLFQTREIRRRFLGEEHPDTLYSTIGLACVYTMQGRHQHAEELLSKTLETVRRVLNEEHFYVLGTMNALAWNYEFQGRYEEAEQLAEQGLEVAQRVLGENDWITLLLKHTIGEVCMYFGEYGKAEEAFQMALKGRSEAWGQEHPDTLQTILNLGLLYLAQGRYEEAESTFVQIQDATNRILGEKHIFNLHLLRGLGTVYLIKGRYNEAKQLLDKAYEIGNHILGEENWATQVVMNMQAKLYMTQGHYDKAEKLYLNTLQIQRRVLGDEHPHTLATINGLAVLRTKQKYYEEAERLFHEALEARKNKLGENNPHTLESKNDLAVLYKEQDTYAKAEPLLHEAVEGRRLKLGDTHPHTVESWNNLIALYESWNKPEKASEWRAKLPKES